MKFAYSRAKRVTRATRESLGASREISCWFEIIDVKQEHHGLTEIIEYNSIAMDEWKKKIAYTIVIGIWIYRSVMRSNDTFIITALRVIITNDESN